MSGTFSPVSSPVEQVMLPAAEVGPDDISMLPVVLELTAGPLGVTNYDMTAGLLGGGTDIFFEVNGTVYDNDDLWTAAEGDVIRLRIRASKWASVSINADVTGAIKSLPPPLSSIQIQASGVGLALTDATLPATAVDVLITGVLVSATVPDPGTAPNISSLTIYSEQLTTFPATHTIPMSMVTLDFNGASLTNEALLNIFNALLVDAENRPGILYVDVSGGNNAVPEGATAAALADLLLANPNATVAVNS